VQPGGFPIHFQYLGVPMFWVSQTLTPAICHSHRDGRYPTSTSPGNVQPRGYRWRTHHYIDAFKPRHRKLVQDGLIFPASHILSFPMALSAPRWWPIDRIRNILSTLYKDDPGRDVRSERETRKALENRILVMDEWSLNV